MICLQIEVLQSLNRLVAPILFDFFPLKLGSLSLNKLLEEMLLFVLDLDVDFAEVLLLPFFELALVLT